MTASRKEIGKRIAASRGARRLTQKQLARKAHISISLLQKIENGNRELTDSALEVISDALSLDPEYLVDGSGKRNSRVHEAIPAIRQTVDAYDFPEDGPIRKMPELRSAVGEATQQRLNSMYSRLAIGAPGLMVELSRALQSTQKGEMRRDAAALMIEAYRAADAAAYKFGYHDLSGRMVEVMRWAADIADDPVLISTVAYVRTEVFFASMNLGPGLRSLESCLSLLPNPTTLEEIAGVGALHMRAAVVAASLLKDAEVADEHLRYARKFAELIPEGVYNGTAFGPSSIHVHEVSVAVELGDAARAIRAAQDEQPVVLLPAERRSHFFIDLARAQLWNGLREEAFYSLLEARQIAPQHVREHPQVREVLATLVRLHLAPSQALIGYADWAGAV